MLLAWGCVWLCNRGPGRLWQMPWIWKPVIAIELTLKTYKKSCCYLREGWYADLSLLAASLLSAPTRSPIGWRPYCDQNMDTSYRIRKDISYMLQSGHKLQLLVLDEKRQMILFFVINFSFLHKNRPFLQSQKRMNPNCRQCKFRTLLHCLSVSSILRWSARQLANGDAENLWWSCWVFNCLL